MNASPQDYIDEDFVEQESDIQEQPSNDGTIFERAAENEEKAFQLFLRVWERSHPKPDVGLFAKLGSVSIIALVILVASATAIPFAAATQLEIERFFPDLPKFISNAIGLLIGIVAIIGVEGFIVTAGLKEGILQTDQELSSRQFYATIILLVISCVAGLYRPMALVGNDLISNFILIALVVASGIGGPVSLFFAAPYLGKILNMQADAENDWLAQARLQFDKSTEAMLARAEIEQQKRLIEIQQQQERRAAKAAANTQVTTLVATNGNGHAQISIRKLTSDEILDWYLAQTESSVMMNISSAEAVRQYLAAKQIEVDAAEFNALTGRVRTELSRRRAKQNT